MGNQGLYSSPVKGKTAVSQAMLRPDWPKPFLGQRYTMNLQPNEITNMNAIIWLDSNDEVIKDWDSDTTEEMADGTDEECFALSDDDVQPSEESLEWSEFCVSGGFGLTVGTSAFYEEDDTVSKLTPMVMYNGFGGRYDRVWRIEDDGVLVQPRESGVDFTSSVWDELDLEFETVPYEDRLLQIPRVTGFAWELFPMHSRPLAPVFSNELEKFLDEDSTRFEIVESIVNFHDLIHGFCNRNQFIQNNFAINFMKAAGSFLCDVDIAFYFTSRTKSARPFGLEGQGKDFDKCIRSRIVASEQLGKNTKCNKCRQDTFTRWSTTVELWLPNGKTRKEIKKHHKCLYPKCKTFNDMIPNCHFCKQKLTREVRDGWAADMCTTYNCEQRFPFCPDHNKAMVYVDNDWECGTCIKIERDAKNKQIAEEQEAEKQRLAKAEEAKKDVFMAAFDDPKPGEAAAPVAKEEAKAEDPVPADAPAPAVDARELPVLDPAVEEARIRALEILRRRREIFFEGERRKALSAGLPPPSIGGMRAAHSAGVDDPGPPLPPPPPKSERPLAKERRKLKKIPARTIPKVITIDPMVVTHTTWHRSYDLVTLFATICMITVIIPMWAAVSFSALIDHWAFILVVSTISWTALGYKKSLLFVIFPHFLNYVYWWIIKVYYYQPFVCLPRNNFIVNLFYSPIDSGCIMLRYNSIYIGLYFICVVFVSCILIALTKEKRYRKVTVYKKFEYLRPYHSHRKGDLRVDAVAIGDIKHEADYSVWKVHTPVKLARPTKLADRSRPQIMYYVESEEIIVSNELMMQLISIDKLHHATKDAVACEILLRSAARNTTINIDKHIALETGQSVSSNTVNLALAWLTQLKQTDPIGLLNRLAAQSERESS